MCWWLMVLAYSVIAKSTCILYIKGSYTDAAYSADEPLSASVSFLRMEYLL